MTESSLSERVARAVGSAPVLDLHTHLFAPQLEGMNLSGVDHLLTYHYLVAELLRVAPVSPEWFFAQSTRAQADLIWDAVVVDFGGPAKLRVCEKSASLCLGRSGLGTMKLSQSGLGKR